MEKEKNDVFEHFDLGQTLIQSLQDAIVYAKGDATKCRVRVYEIPTPAYTAEDVRRIRNHLRISQAGLALALGVSKRTVEAWETGKNAPSNASNKLLYLIENNEELINQLVSVQ